MAEAMKLQISVDVETYRRKSGISVYELSNLTGIPRSSLRTRLEHPGQFTLDQISSITEVLNIPAHAIHVEAAA